jgi:hypothetical protein
MGADGIVLPLGVGLQRWCHSSGGLRRLPLFAKQEAARPFPSVVAKNRPVQVSITESLSGKPDLPRWVRPPRFE